MKKNPLFGLIASLLLMSQVSVAENQIRLRYIENNTWGFVEIANEGKSEIKVESNIVIRVGAVDSQGREYKNESHDFSEIHRVSNDRAAKEIKVIIIPGETIVAIPVRSFMFGGVDVQPFDVKSIQMDRKLRITECAVDSSSSSIVSQIDKMCVTRTCS